MRQPQGPDWPKWRLWNPHCVTGFNLHGAKDVTDSTRLLPVTMVASLRLIRMTVLLLLRRKTSVLFFSFQCFTLILTSSLISCPLNPDGTLEMELLCAVLLSSSMSSFLAFKSTRFHGDLSFTPLYYSFVTRYCQNPWPVLTQHPTEAVCREFK